MPYPILTLPYPFAKRLRQLLNPFEIEELQKAAGKTVISPLKPIVTSCKVDTIEFKQNPMNDHAYGLYHRKNHISLPEKDQYFIKCVVARFSDMSEGALNTLKTDQLLIKLKRINLEGCHISHAFLRNVSKMMVVQPTQLDMRFSPAVDEDVKFSTILDIFSCLTHIALKTSYFGWLDDLASTGKKFHIAEVFDDNFEKMFSFCPKALYNFVNKQYADFHFRLFLMTDNIQATVDKIKPFIDPRFDCIINGHIKICIFVCYNGAKYERLEYFYKKA
uniref:F-box domain-containing protein n=1 Tax=Panagrellus redivivus TaxID=6233 RepID=A0A7E4ZWC7_PANRE